MAFGQELRFYLFPRRTRAKSAFTIIDWQYTPLASTDVAEAYPYCGGFVLKFRVHDNENRRHLRRSLRSCRSRTRLKRLVVVASANDMCTPMSWVRCLVVNVEALRLPKRTRGWVVARSADPSLVNGRVWFRSRQITVPDDAVWLVVPESQYVEPSSCWGASSTRHRQQPDTGVALKSCSDVGNLSYVRKRVTTLRRNTISLWSILLGLGLSLVVGISAQLTDDWLPFLASYLTVSLLVLLAVLVYLLYDAARALLWCLREGQRCGWVGHLLRSRKERKCCQGLDSKGKRCPDWKGRTDECLIMGDLLRMGPNQICDEKMQEYMESAPDEN